jgi:hypothetical protein
LSVDIVVHAKMAVASRPSLTLSILRSYFGETNDMMSYLSERLELTDGDYGSIPQHLLRDIDSPTYRALISTAYVASKISTVDNGNKRLFKVYQPIMYMREVSPQILM